MPGRETDVPVFIAVTEGDTMLDKHVYPMHVVFPIQRRSRHADHGRQLNLILPVTPTKSGAAYTILAGFQLTPDQMARTAADRHTMTRTAARTPRAAPSRPYRHPHIARTATSRAARSDGVQPAAQLVDLIEQRQHQRDGVLADLHIATQVMDQANPRHIDLVELEAGVRGIRQTQPRSTQWISLDRVRSAKQRGDRGDVHHSVSRPARGLIGWRGFQVFRNSASSGSSLGGRTGWSSTN